LIDERRYTSRTLLKTLQPEHASCWLLAFARKPSRSATSDDLDALLLMYIDPCLLALAVATPAESQRAAFDAKFGSGDLVWTNNIRHEPKWAAMIWDARFDTVGTFEGATKLFQTHRTVLFFEGNGRAQKLGFVKFRYDYITLAFFSILELTSLTEACSALVLFAVQPH
jgi:hypothetical protein